MLAKKKFDGLKLVYVDSWNMELVSRDIIYVLDFLKDASLCSGYNQETWVLGWFFDQLTG